MQRVRVGLMGLAVVFLLVLLAAAFFGLASGGSDVARPGVPASTLARASATADKDSPKEPLAELGVAPGGSSEVANSSGPHSTPAR